ncbi:TonB-dependent receptor [Niastella yeongjuensis]|uniref:TonB-dependent receptor n=1 Tax=Niastella yeongjuensis TaxID=354355 RepID=A0A1V9EXK8_9BACT|nr:carboxypeptidase regulatory-like domain-containing protein [Niastella yeongjuensis]OQP50853.1 TonB-dependent receptor [Niastella yeongjuensis]SEN14613.1 Carboxypeptidase regulatory-like domain-containing protein [Niastella yeongjuensis]
MKRDARYFFTLLLLFCSPALFSQVTTATLSGIVKDPKGAPLPSATVVIEYPDAGFKQTLATKGDGRFTVPNLRVGGPYTVTVSFINYQSSVTDNVFLELGQNNSVEVQMHEKAAELEKVTVTGRGTIFDNKKTGASTNINSRLIKTLPTISRSADDYIRLTPSASFTYNGLSFAGRNGQYNNFSLDGAVFNNPFGLDAPTPGGQTGAQPISLDAIDQIQVNIAPYDVTQAGFTGAGVNTVTKSGNNNFTGTVYGFYRNESLTGSKIEKNKLVLPDLKQLQAGFALGGPVIKNKLYYFVSFETEQRKDQASSYIAQTPGNVGKTNTSRVLETDLQQVSSILKSRYNYDTGPYQDFTLDQTNYKWLVKLDWNITDKHRLSFTYNGLDASKDKPAHPSAIGRRGPDYTTLQFRNSGYEIVNKLQSFGAELKSTFGSDYANKLRVVYTTFRDNRNPFSTPFPVINITKNGVNYIIAGHEPFSINNILNQDAFQVTDNFNMFFKNHTVTAGASFESFKFANSFNLTGYGGTIFSGISIKNFIDSVPVGGKYDADNSLDTYVNYARNRGIADQWTWYYLTVGQASAYVQDEWQLADHFRLTLGLRMDIPFYFNARFRNPIMNGDGTFGGKYDEGEPTLPNKDNLTLFNEDGKPVTNGPGKDVDNTKLPDKKPLFSPRLGFNWDVKGDKTIQVRGGTGLFTGRFPFVWLGNHIGNPYSFFYNVTARDFKWPQVWRSNIGTDWKIPFGTIFTVDFAYTKDVNGMMVRNYKLGTPTGTLNSGTGDKRKVYLPADQGTANAYVFTNTSVGYQFNGTFQAQQFFKNGLYAMVGYNYLIAKDASSISAEISSDAFDRNPILNNANTAVLSRSLYGNTHRIVAAFSKKFSYAKVWATTVSLFGSWNSGNRFAYVYGGDINNDATSTNDLLYVPTDAEINNMQFADLTDVNGVVQNAAAQRQALKNFINNDKYLSGRRGGYTEKYAGENPWVSQVDLRILQDLIIPVKKRQSTLQLSIDFVNIGNLLNSNWGVVKYATTSGYFQPLSVSYNGNAPVYQFDPSLTKTFTASPDLPSRWQMQLGLRYTF